MSGKGNSGRIFSKEFKPRAARAYHALPRSPTGKTVKGEADELARHFGVRSLTLLKLAKEFSLTGELEQP